MNIDIVQAAFVRPLAEAARSTGMPVDRYLRSARLDSYRLYDGQGYVPTPALFCLIQEIAQDQTGSELPAELLGNYRLTELGEFGLAILGCRDLLTACTLVNLPAAQQFSQERLSYRIEGSRAHLIDEYTWGNGLPQLLIEQMNLHLIIDGLRAAGGKDWLPTEVHLTADDVPNSYVEELAGQGVVIRLGQPALKVTFPSSLLAAPIRSDLSETASTDAMPRLPDSVSVRLERILDTTTPSHSGAIIQFAGELGLSPRTLQRLLANDGETFSGLVEKWRLKSALQLLACERTPISEISERLHYGHASNFIRAFKRWTNTTPEGYRDHLASHH